MKILACYKIIPEDQDIIVNSNKTLALDKAELKISPYDLNAVEAGVEIAAAVPGSTLVGLSVGNKKYLENSKLRKDVLSRGPDSLSLVIDDAYASLLPEATAKILAQAATKEGFDLILCGEGSGDFYSQQVGTLLGEYLDLPNINSVSKIIPGNGSITVERTLESEVETLEVPLPAVISVTTDINVPKVPNMKSILNAGKKTVSTLEIAADAGQMSAENLSILAPDQADRLNIIVEGDSDDSIAAFIENIRKVLA